jgi:NAD(P)-dependent dehydrogenase (short-subunit alcohol dehydrogenase family)
MMVERFHERVAVVTGGASGIGRAAVLRLLDEGASVLFADLNEANAGDTLETAAKAGFADRVAFELGDVTVEDDVRRFMEAAVSRWGRLDAAFLNAGVGGAFGPVTDTTVEEWDATFAFLVRSVFLGVKHAVPHMRRQGGGAFVATASVAGLAGGGGSHAYSAAKAAVINMVRSIATELGQYRIRINAVAPGLIDTPLAHGGNPDRLPDMSNRQPWPDLGQPEDIAAAVAYLASDDARFVTGETLVVDGGTYAAGANIWGLGEQGPFYRKAGLNRGTTGLGSDVREPGETD